MPASTADNLTPVSRTRAIAGALLLAAWIGWTLPALWAQARPAPVRHASDWTAAQLLAQLPADVVLASTVQPLLLHNPSLCPCAQALPPGALQRQAGTSALPFEWLVLADRRLIYAGPALLDRSCGSTPVAATALVTHLLREPQASLLLSPHCPCQKE